MADSFALCTQNYKPFSLCKYIRRAIYFCLPVIASAERCVAILFSFKGVADSFALCAQNDTPFSYHECRKVCAVSCCPVIAVRVSGGHLCEAEAPTEPAGETTVRCAAIRFSFETPAQAEIVIRFVLNLRN